MKLFVVISAYPYEGSDLVGIFSTEALAVECAEKQGLVLTDNPRIWGNYATVEIQEWELNKEVQE